MPPQSHCTLPSSWLIQAARESCVRNVLRGIVPALLCCGAAVSAQEVTPPPLLTDSAPALLSVPALKPVDLEILAPLNSKTSKIGEMFPIKLSAPLMLGDRVIVPAGAKGEGEVIHAAKARAAGKPGELILAARYIDHEGQRVRLRSFSFGPSSTGKSHVDTANAINVASAVAPIVPVVLFIVGGQVDVPAGTAAHAKLAEPLNVPAAPKVSTPEEKTP